MDGLDGGRCALITKIHHSITDGVGGIKLLMELLDLERDVPPRTSHARRAEAEPRGEPGRMADALAYEGRRQVGRVSATWPARAWPRSAG